MATRVSALRTWARAVNRKVAGAARATWGVFVWGGGWCFGKHRHIGSASTAKYLPMLRWPIENIGIIYTLHRHIGNISIVLSGEKLPILYYFHVSFCPGDSKTCRCVDVPMFCAPTPMFYIAQAHICTPTPMFYIAQAHICTPTPMFYIAQAHICTLSPADAVPVVPMCRSFSRSARHCSCWFTITIVHINPTNNNWGGRGSKNPVAGLLPRGCS